MVRVIGTLAMVLLIFGAIAYASGWVNFQSSGDTTTIEMNTGKMKDAADKALDKGKEIIDEAGKKLNELGGDANVENPDQ